MSRTFNGTSDHIDFSAGGANRTWGAISMAAFAYRNATGTWHSLMVKGTQTGSDNQFIGWEIGDTGTSNKLSVELRATQSLSNTIQITNTGWYLFAFTKASGAATGRFHSYRVSTGAWTHEAGSASQSSPTSGTGTIKLGVYEATGFTGDYYDGDIEAFGLFEENLSDQDVESLAFSWEHWIRPTTIGLWRLDQAATSTKVIDWMGGGANESAIGGTSVSTRSTPLLAWTSPPIQRLAVTAAAATATPSALSTPFSFPAPTIQAQALATPSNLATPFTFPAPTVTGAAKATPSNLSTPFSFPAPSPTGAALVTPTNLSTPFSFPAPDAVIGVIATPSNLATPFSFPSPSVVADQNVAGPVLTTNFSFPGATITAGATITPSALSTPFTFPAPTPNAPGIATPSNLATNFAFPSPTISGAALVTPSRLQTPFSFPAPTVDVTGNATATPAALSTPFSFPAPSPQVPAAASMSDGIHVPFRVARRRRKRR